MVDESRLHTARTAASLLARTTVGLSAAGFAVAAVGIMGSSGLSTSCETTRAHVFASRSLQKSFSKHGRTKGYYNLVLLGLTECEKRPTGT